ncbi:MAG: serine hydrolase domain-containing protein [Rhodothermales bacterium]
MTSYRIAALLLLVGLTGCRDATTPAHSESDHRGEGPIKTVDRLVQDLVLNGHTAGVAVAVQIGDDVPFVKTYGVADVEAEAPVRPETRFGIASVTKPFTAMAIARLVEADLLRFDDPIERFFPDFPRAGEVTVRDLLAHTSGIADWWMGGLPEGTPDTWAREPEPHRYLARMNTVYLVEPGTQFAYASSNYVLLGEIVEAVTGKPVFMYLDEQVFEPLGMRETGLWGEEAAVPRARGHARVDAGDSLATSSFQAVDFPAAQLGAAGGLESSVRDMLVWSRALFDGELVADSLLDEMTAYAHVRDGRPVYDAMYTPPGSPPASMPGYMQRSGYGLGFNLTDMFGEPVVWHSGGMPGFNAIWVYIPASRTSLILVANTDNGAVPAFEEIVRALVAPA